MAPKNKGPNLKINFLVCMCKYFKCMNFLTHVIVNSHKTWNLRFNQLFLHECNGVFDQTNTLA